jgi:hypothetical protein
MEFKIAYDDTDLLGPLALPPAVKPFWHFSGPSPVVPRKTQAWDFAIDLNSGLTVFQGGDMPLKGSFPFLMAVANAQSYGGAGTFVGHVTPALNLSVPLPKAVTPPIRFWSLYVGVEYARDLERQPLQGRPDRVG